MNTLVLSKSINPYENIALEECLFNLYCGGVTLYLWQNAKTVVIGKCQNAFRECNLQALEKDGAYLARRRSGGGAVYHHLGNLNFTFIAGDGIYDVNRQLAVILKAVKSFGIDAAFSGRNDITADGRKFSGNAFYHGGGIHLHHGTLLVDEDTQKMSAYLTVSEKKLSGNSVSSVRARVVNLKELNNEVTVSRLTDALINCFDDEYGGYEKIEASAFDFSKEYKKYSSKEWILGSNPPFTLEIAKKLSLGEIVIRLDIKNNIIRTAAVFSDSLDTDAPPAVEAALTSIPFEKDAVKTALLQSGVRFYPEIYEALSEAF